MRFTLGPFGSILTLPTLSISRQLLQATMFSSATEQVHERQGVSVIKPMGQTDLTFSPSAASVMCSGMSFSISLFYPSNVVSESLLKSSLSHLVQESPVMAGKIVKSSNGFFLPRFANCAIEYNREHGGVVLRSQTDKNATIRDIIDKIWSNTKSRTLHEVMNYNHRLKPLDPVKSSELAMMDLVRCKDGSIVTLHISHILADAGRAFKLMERLSSIYETLRIGKEYVAQKTTYDTWFGKTLDPSSLQAEKDGKYLIKSLEFLRLQPGHLLEIPSAIKHHMSAKYVPVYFHVPRSSIESLQDCISRTWCSHHRPSKLDIVQALNITLISSIRNNRFVPAPGENVIINVDLSKAYNPANIVDTLGNSSAFLEISGSKFHGPRQNITEALATNAITIRNQVKELYSNPSHNVKSRLHRQHVMSHAPKHLVLAAYLLHGTREKLASCSAIASFPTEQVRQYVYVSIYDVLHQ